MNNQFQKSISKISYKSQIQKSILKIFISVSQRRKEANKIGIGLCVFVSWREIKL